MKTPVIVTAELISPLIIVRERQERVYSCLDHIPGTTLRGALASALWRRTGGRAEVDRLLERGRNRFPTLRPGPLGTTPAMITTVSCKRAKEKHGLRDTLLRRDGKGAWTCQTCGLDLKRQEGYLHDGKLAPPVLRAQRMHVGIDRARGTAAPHVLFGATAVEPVRPSPGGGMEPLRMTGRAWLHPDDLTLLRNIAEEPIFVGKQRSRGFGELRVRFEDDFDDARAEEIAAGSEALNATVGPADGTLFTLGVSTPLIAYDPWLRASARWESWGIESLEIGDVVEFLVETTSVDGWDFAAGIARDADEAVAPGGVLFARSRLPTKDLARALAALEREGVGERRDEGFGEVIANDRIHWEQV